MNATTTFRSDGNWTINVYMACTLRANLTYLNASHVGLADDYAFSCDETYSPGIITPCDILGGLYTRVLKSRFAGLLAKVNISGGNSRMNWAGRGIEQYLENKLGSYFHKRGRFGYFVSPKFGQLLHKYLSQIVQKNSVLDMMDFDLNKYYEMQFKQLFLVGE
ncbi:uncharacterized protein LOC118434092 [Folsomia candida]|uniref:uncharacterized protein LOC118434092 n=1 Tax=Folsomia candida TaxID=158441 RepID=UPI0016051573|nr:uncharacterized protein LOC118434092 [Folsomia candida]